MKVILAVVVIALVIFYFFTSSKNKQQAEQNLKTGTAFLIQNKNKPNIIETPSGLQYEILHKSNNTEHPKATDTVKVHYHGTLINGDVFDSSVDRNKAISFPLNKVIKGWTEGLQLMSIDDKFRFYIPSNLAYGKQNMGKIPGNSVLIFDVELLGIN